MQNQNGIQGAKIPVCDEGAIAANPDYAQWHHRLHVEGHKNEGGRDISADYCNTHDLSPPSVRRRVLAFAILEQILGSVEAASFYQKGKWIERKLVRETVSEQAEPTILCDIGELLTLLWAFVFKTKHILKMMNHLMNENR